jgi:predicted unusual protein kinase regulating ubiquinone biosynthesis (AarF/ABC1/UbiB family)
MTAAASIAQGHLAMLKDRKAVAVKVGWCGVTYYYGLGFVIATR